MEWERTNVFVTEDEAAEVKELQATYQLAGLTAARLGPQRASAAHEKMMRKIHEFALAHGLLETGGYYGIDTSNGEFLVFTEEASGGW